MRVRFYIEKRKDKEGKLLTVQRPIFMTVAFHGERVLIATGRKVDLHWWIPETQRVSDLCPDASEINRWLETLEHTASVVWKALVSLSGKPGVAEFKETFKQMKPRFSQGFFDVFLQFMDEGNARWSKNTYIKVRSFYKQLKSFESERGYALDFDKMNTEFINNFSDWMKQAGRGDTSLRNSINILVWFLNWAREQNYNIYNSYRKFYKSLERAEPGKKAPAFYLYWEELMLLNSYQTDSTREERVRDMFCLICFTGISYRELGRLKREDVEETRIIIQKESGKLRVVPLNKYAIAILERYQNKYYREGKALPSISLVTMNKYLKILARKCKLNRLVPDEKGPEMRALHESISTRIGVQTFILQAMRLDILPEVIASYTGIKSDKRVLLLKQELAKEEIRKFDAL